MPLLAGTALGDPIEVGAATAVLPGAGLPLRLTAAKSRFGHAEPAAGSIGMMHAAAQLGMQCSNSITGLTAINPYVASTLSELATAGGQRPYLPRQDVAAVLLPLPADVGGEGAMGVSSFAFQGTNAHVVLARTAGLEPAASPSVAPATWRRQRFWYTAPQHQMLQRCAVSMAAGTAAMQCQLSKSHLAYLCDHQVRRGTRHPLCISANANLDAADPFVSLNPVELPPVCPPGARPHPLPRCRHA